MGQKNINVGLLGHKFMGKAHSNAYRKMSMFFDPSARVTMKAIFGLEEDEVITAAKKFGWESYETSWEKLVRRNDIDMIDIAAATKVHKDAAIAAANEGKHVFCEKPLALNLAEARQVLEVVKKCKVKHQIGFNYRFVPAIVFAKKLIDEGKIGKIFHVRASFLQSWLIDPDVPLGWKLDKKLCGSGSLGDLGSHAVDLARFLAGEFESVAGMEKTFVKTRPVEGAKKDGLRAEVEVDDATVFVARFKNGAMGTFETSRFAQGHKSDLSIEINGEYGGLKFCFERMNELHYHSAKDEPGTQGFRLIQASEVVHPYMKAWWPAGHVIGYEHTFVHELYEFAEAIANDTETCPSFEDGVKCAQIVEAVEISCKNKTSVKIDEV
ncbi:MAG: Gfo/Idh/MocA family oxidoreductase [Oscillospiraceae bacterium]|nr:Gfo/Idh/MocA family oxidoreductase [Oscillospiraceae bacterium]